MKETREALGLRLEGNVVIVDEGHNLGAGRVKVAGRYTAERCALRSAGSKQGARRLPWPRTSFALEPGLLFLTEASLSETLHAALLHDLQWMPSTAAMLRS